MGTKNSPRPRGPMGRPPKMGMVAEKAKDFKGTLKKLLKYLGRYKIAIVIVLVFAMLSTVFSIVGPKILGEATTILFEGIMNMISENGLGIDFVRNKEHLDYITRTIYSKCSFFIYSRLDNDKSYNECNIQIKKRYFTQNKQIATKLF